MPPGFSDLATALPSNQSVRMQKCHKKQDQNVQPQNRAKKLAIRYIIDLDSILLQDVIMICVPMLI